MPNLIKVACLRQLQGKEGFQCIVLRTAKEANMFSIVRSREEQVFNVFFKQNHSALPLHVTNAEFIVEDVVKFEKLIPTSKHTDCPLLQTYYIFGDEHDAYISHVVTKRPDFFQVNYCLILSKIVNDNIL